MAHSQTLDAKHLVKSNGGEIDTQMPRSREFFMFKCLRMSRGMVKAGIE